MVSIGLDNKGTKMLSVFMHYCKFVTKSNDPVEYDDLEFVHNDVLSSNDTAEGCAIMKGDRIFVRKQRKHLRKQQEILVQAQQESDKDYLKQVRGLFLESVNASSALDGFPPSAGGPNLVLECRPYLEVGQRGVLNHFIKAHEAIVAKRCPWLKDKIKQARQDLALARSVRESAAREAGERRYSESRVVTIPDVLDRESSSASRNPKHDHIQNNQLDRLDPHFNPTRRDRRKAHDDDDDDENAVMHLENDAQNGQIIQGQQARGHQPPNIEHFHQIDDNDDENESIKGGDDLDDYDASHVRNQSNDDNTSFDLLNESRLEGQSDMVWLSLKNHPPEAVKLLLEYCYTNRVVSLGKEAFTQASTKTAVMPYQSTLKWPNHGQPTVSMTVTLAGIALAEEAKMPRLSLMCEIAASHLVNDANVLDALSSCTQQMQTTGNRLNILRKKAMDYLLYVPLLNELGETKKWLHQLKERREFVVPALLQGAEEMLATHKHLSKRKKSHDEDEERKRELHLAELDRKDKERRRIERASRRKERQMAGVTRENFGTITSNSLPFFMY